MSTDITHLYVYQYMLTNNRYLLDWGMRKPLIPATQVHSSPFHKWSPTTPCHATPPTDYTSFFLLQPLPPIFPGQPLSAFKTSTRCAVELNSRALFFWMQAICISHWDEGSRLNWENKRARETGKSTFPKHHLRA